MESGILARSIVGLTSLAVVGIAGVVAGAQPAHVELCHATGSNVNPYVKIAPSVNGAFNGHYSHHGRDIIPPFEYHGKTYSLNWGAEGRAIFENDCVPPAQPQQPPQVEGEPPIVNEPAFTG